MPVRDDAGRPVGALSAQNALVRLLADQSRNENALLDYVRSVGSPLSFDARVDMGFSMTIVRAHSKSFVSPDRRNSNSAARSNYLAVTQ